MSNQHFPEPPQPRWLFAQDRSSAHASTSVQDPRRYRAAPHAGRDEPPSAMVSMHGQGSGAMQHPYNTSQTLHAGSAPQSRPKMPLLQQHGGTTVALRAPPQAPPPPPEEAGLLLPVNPSADWPRLQKRLSDTRVALEESRMTGHTLQQQVGGQEADWTWAGC